MWTMYQRNDLNRYTSKTVRCKALASLGAMNCYIPQSSVQKVRIAADFDLTYIDVSVTEEPQNIRNSLYSDQASPVTHL